MDLSAVAQTFEKKPVHSQRRAILPTKLLFCWLLPVLVRGWLKGFDQNDILPPSPQYEASILGDKLEHFWSFELLSKKTPSLWRAIFKICWKELIQSGIIVFTVQFLVKLPQPVLISTLITKHTMQENTYAAYVCGVLLVLSSFLDAFLFNWSVFVLRNLGLKMRIACFGLIYRKSLKLDRNKTATGQMISLLSNDLIRFDRLFLQLHYLWVAPLTSVVALFSLYIFLDLSGVVGIAPFFLVLPVSIYMGWKYSQFRLKTAVKTDERLRQIDEIVSGIQLIKMDTLEEFFIKPVEKERKEEIKYIRIISYLRAIQNALNKFLAKGAVFLCVLVYVFNGNHLHALYVFVLKTFYNNVKENMTQNLPEAIKNIAETWASLKRIEQFLQSPEMKFDTKKGSPQGVHFADVKARWPSAPVDTLTDMNFEAVTGQLVTISGLVGSGKSSLLSVILGELRPKQGKVQVAGSVSYARQEPWLFAGTIKQNIVFGQPWIEGRYRDVIKACALEHDFHVLPGGDACVIGDRGITLSGGQKARINLARAVYRDADVYLLDDPLASVDVSIAKQLFERCIFDFLRTKCVVLVTHQIDFLQHADVVYVLKDGRVASRGSCREVCRHFGRVLRRQSESKDGRVDPERDHQVVVHDRKRSYDEGRCSGTVGWSVYKRYLFSGGWIRFSGIVVMFALSQGLQSGTDYFETYWIKLEDASESSGTRSRSSAYCILVYSSLTAAMLVFSVATSLSFYAYFVKISAILHNNMLSAIMRAGFVFFRATPAGAILNRFSKDMATVDTYLPKCLSDAIECCFNVVAIFVLISIVNPWMLLATVALLFVFYCTRAVYLATAREVKRLEATSRTPIYSFIKESLEGSDVIRAFNAQAERRAEFEKRVNKNTSRMCLLVSLYSTFAFWLNFLCSAYLGFVVFGCFCGRGKYGPELGLMVTQAMGLTNMFQWGVTQWSEFEAEMTSVERIQEYTDVEREEDVGKEEIIMCSSGIRFVSISLSYAADIPITLDNVSFTVAPKEKVCIVGRTGAGKSSLIGVLFRLDKYSGTVEIGEHNIEKLPLKSLRSQLSVIPQDPFVFSGTIRLNLDPFGRFSSCDLWTVLEQVHLKASVSDMPSGLDSFGCNLSVGQKQLLCLARALLKNNKIVVLDEATAHTDYETDALIRSVIRERLRECTVVMVAHRLNAVVDCDKVLVMEKGRVVEFDHPHRLLQNTGGTFSGLLAKMESKMADEIRKVVEENYKGRAELNRS